LRAANAVGLSSAQAPRITVLLYHRVTDEVRDNLTVGIAQFDRQMELIRAHCQPLSIEEVLGSSTIPRAKKPLVAVTFDDGYLDNYEHAVPILERHGIPAAFYVSTGIVNSDNRFPHDIRRENPPIPVMSWDQLRAMRRRGFTIGSHSVYHIDCAAEPEARVKEELVRSRDDLVRELDLREVMFAYPYGGRRHMTPERLELVKQTGYVACLSAYGGTNVRHVDRYNILRRGIHWGFDDAAFLLECHGVTRTTGNPR
jgi:peptidoglycan/xylan/chitin deacetylase (PgdA/CDA1 family)